VPPNQRHVTSLPGDTVAGESDSVLKLDLKPIIPHVDNPVVAGGTGKYDSTRLFPKCGIFCAEEK
jgi:hypothetical protein